MEPIDISYYYRPPRLAFVVTSADEASLAMDITSILWGGIFNEIHHVDNFTWDIRLFDFFVIASSVTNPPPQLNDLTFKIDDVFKIEGKKHLPMFRDVFCFYSMIDKQAASPALSNDTSLLGKFRFGSFPKSSTYDCKDLFLNSLSPTVRTDSAKWARGIKESFFYPLDFTRFELFQIVRNSRRRTAEIVYYIGDTTNYQDILNVWNLRARGKTINFLDASTLADDVPLAQQWRDNAQKNLHPNNPMHWPSQLFTCTNPEPIKEQLKTACETMKMGCYSLEGLMDLGRDPFDFFPRMDSNQTMGFLTENSVKFTPSPVDFLEEREHGLQKSGLAIELPRIYRRNDNSILHSIPLTDFV